MVATDTLYLDPPTDNDLAIALQAWREGRLRRDLEPGTQWSRILRARSPGEALEFARVCYPSEANSRFSPLRRSGQVVPAAYAGDRPETAAWEVILRDIHHKGVRRIPEHQTRDRYPVEARLTQTISVLDIRRPLIENLVAAGKQSPCLTGAPRYQYDQTRHWHSGFWITSLRCAEYCMSLTSSRAIASSCLRMQPHSCSSPSTMRFP